jgi:hypothetical protein
VGVVADPANVVATFACPVCGLGLVPPQGVRWWQPAADSDPGPVVTAVARWGVSPQLWRMVRVSGGWVIDGPDLDVAISRGLIPAEGPVALSWRAIGLCRSATMTLPVSHPVVAVHRDATGRWMLGIAPNSSADQRLRLTSSALGEWAPAPDDDGDRCRGCTRS